MFIAPWHKLNLNMISLHDINTLGRYQQNNSIFHSFDPYAVDYLVFFLNYVFTLITDRKGGSNKIFIGMPIIPLSLPSINTTSGVYPVTMSSVFCA